MNNKFLFLTFLLGLFLTCTVEQTNTNYIARSWQINKCYQNNTDFTAQFKAMFRNYSISFTKEGMFTESYVDTTNSPVGNTGSWKFNNGVKNLIMVYGDSVRLVNYKIILITKQNLNIQQDSAVIRDYLLIPL
jgi:hypothetical protein